MATFSELLANLDPSPQVRGRQFERICKWYLRHDPLYRAQVEDVWLWGEWPDRDGRDLGIDLVARAKTGELWAIQAKAYDPGKTLRKSDVDSFLANSAQKTFAFRLILTTCQDLTDNLRKQFTQVEPPVSARVLSDLESAGIIWPESPDDHRAPKPEPKTPRPHQKEAIQAVLKGFKKHDRGRLVMACGTGKTLVGLWVAEKLKSERTLVLLPSLSLLGQTMEEWLANGKRTPEVLAVCSDETVGKDADAWVSDTSELGIPVTTDPEEIAAFLDRPGPRLVFSTYQSSPEIAEAQTLTDMAFDLAVADEAHRCAGRVSGAFATVLKAEEIRADRRLFMTATPRYFTGRVKELAGQENLEIASMNDEAKFGPEFHKLTFGTAIERDLLSPYQVVIIGVDDPTYKDLAKHGEFVAQDGEEINARTLATHIALAKAMKKYDLRRMISFHRRIDLAERFAEQFPQVVDWMPKEDGPDGDLWCAHVSGKMRTNQRKARLDRLRAVDGGGRGLLSNARCLGEGVDVPTLDGVVFVDRRRSQVDIVQNVGRAIRKADDKTIGTIVLPVFIDSSEDAETAVEGSDFKPVWDVLRALRDHDDDLGEWIDELRRKRDWGESEAGGWPDNIVFDVDVRFAEAIRTHALDRIAARPKLTEEKILELADAHFERNAFWPKTDSGPIPELLGDNWRNIDNALRLGLRGLGGGPSLAELLYERRAVWKAGPLSEEMILGWVDDFHAATGDWPKVKSGAIEGAPVGETWAKVNLALSRGIRGLEGGISLSQFLALHRGVRRHKTAQRFSEERVLEWADSYHDRTGTWPKQNSGLIPGTTDTWANINGCLREGKRGLPGGSSLAQLLEEHRGVRNIKNLPDLNTGDILDWADSYKELTGQWPQASSGPVTDRPGETWTGINLSLARGTRGLSGGSSLAKLLAAERSVRNQSDLEPLSDERILEWADEHHARTGEWPKVLSGPIEASGGREKWANINACLRNGNRGLPGGSSLAKLLDEHRRKKK